MSSAGATLELRGVTKRFGAKAAVDGLSLAVPAGSICMLVGPSGSGKTTSLRMINRLVEPTEGRILIDGRDVTHGDAPLLRRRIGYVIQQIGLFPHRTIAENIATVPRLLGWPKDRIAARVAELVALIGLDRTFLARYPSELSGGERQRVGVARALAAEPPLMLMDEPFGAVDPIVRERLQDEFLRIQRTLGTTVVFVTHDIDEAIKLGDRVAVMKDGRLVQFAPPAELLDAPADDFVARFVGADRGLKRLALVTVGELSARQAETVRAGDRVAAGDGFVLLLDAAGRPSGWIDRRRPDAAPMPASPVFRRSTRARDALSELMSEGAVSGVVVDDDGRYAGIVGVPEIAAALGQRA